jgi:transposase
MVRPRGASSIISGEEAVMQIRTLGIDLGKTSFHAVGLDDHGHVVVRRRFSRMQLTRFIATLSSCRIGMEACCGAH